MLEASENIREYTVKDPESNQSFSLVRRVSSKGAPHFITNSSTISRWPPGKSQQTKNIPPNGACHTRKPLQKHHALDLAASASTFTQIATNKSSAKASAKSIQSLLGRCKASSGESRNSCVHLSTKRTLMINNYLVLVNPDQR